MAIAFQHLSLVEQRVVGPTSAFTWSHKIKVIMSEHVKK